MTKPITVERAEFAAKIVEAVNGTGLPAFVVADILRDILAAVQVQAEKQYKADTEAWEAAQAEEDRKDAGDDQ